MPITGAESVADPITPCTTCQAQVRSSLMTVHLAWHVAEANRVVQCVIAALAS